MKHTKIITLLIAILVIGGTAFADVSLGINGSFGSGVGSVRTGEFDDIYGASDDNMNIIPGFLISSQITFGSESGGFFIRPEAGMLFNNGVGNGFHFTYEDETIGISNDSLCEVSVSTIDIPVLFGMESKVSDVWILDYYMGPYISIPLAGMITSAELTSQLKGISPIFGGTAGVTGNIKAGPGFVVLDMRYLFDFSSTKMEATNGEPVSLYARRNIILNAGYKLAF